MIMSYVCVRSPTVREGRFVNSGSTTLSHFENLPSLTVGLLTLFQMYLLFDFVLQFFHAFNRRVFDLL